MAEFRSLVSSKIIGENAESTETDQAVLFNELPFSECKQNRHWLLFIIHSRSIASHHIGASRFYVILFILSAFQALFKLQQNIWIR